MRRSLMSGLTDLLKGSGSTFYSRFTRGTLTTISSRSLIIKKISLGQYTMRRILFKVVISPVFQRTAATSMITEQWQDYGFEITNTKSKDIYPNYLNYTLNLHNEPLYMFEY